MKVGFIGLGQMGLGMAASLLKVGHEVTVYNRTRSKADELVRKGAVAAKRIADACAGDAVITMLANDARVESVVYGDQGVRASLRKGAVHISSSTISVALCERLAVDHAVGLRFVAAPVFGRPDVAAGRTDRRCRWLSGHHRRGDSAVGCNRPTDLRDVRSAPSREPRQAQRKFSDRLSHRGSRRSHGARREGWHRPGTVS
jgi:hypothetical protein